MKIKQIYIFSLLFLGFILATPSAFGQRQKSRNMPFYDEKKLHYGFQIGLHSSTFLVKHSDFFAQNSDSTVAITPNFNSGFSLGFILNFRLKDDLWDIRFLPNVVFYERNITFSYPNSVKQELFESTFIDLPIIFKYKSLRRNNHRFYLFAGLTPSFKVGSKREELLDKSLLTKNFNLQTEYGIGWDKYMSMFKLSPEIRFSHGMTNMLLPNGYTYSNNINRLLSHKVALVFNFE